MKKHEENKAAVVDILTTLAKLATEATNESDLKFIDTHVANMGRCGRLLTRLEFNLALDICAEIFRFIDGGETPNTDPEKVKKFESDKTTIVEVLTTLADALRDATTDDTIKLADFIGSKVPDVIDLDRRKRVLYIGIACDILHYLNID